MSVRGGGDSSSENTLWGVQQSVLGRIFNYGTVIVKGTGAGIEPVRNVSRPLKLREAVASISQAS